MNTTIAGRATLGTIEAEALYRLSMGIGDLLLWAFDCGWLAGSGQMVLRPENAGLAALLDTLIDRHRVESERIGELEPIATEMPEWHRAHAERRALEVRDASTV